MGMVLSFVIVLLIAADQIIKSVVNRQILPDQHIPVIEDFFYLVNRKNSGAAWSFLAGADWGIYVLAAVSALVTVVLLIALFRTSHTGLRVALTMITAGSVGNLIDRIRLKAVTDYLDFHFGRYIFPTFNLADMLIVCGTILLMIFVLIDQTLLDQPLLPWQKRRDMTDHES